MDKYRKIEILKAERLLTAIFFEFYPQEKTFDEQMARTIGKNTPITPENTRSLLEILISRKALAKTTDGRLALLPAGKRIIARSSKYGMHTTYAHYIKDEFIGSIAYGDVAPILGLSDEIYHNNQFPIFTIEPIGMHEAPDGIFSAQAYLYKLQGWTPIDMPTAQILLQMTGQEAGRARKPRRYIYDHILALRR